MAFDFASSSFVTLDMEDQIDYSIYNFSLCPLWVIQPFGAEIVLCNSKRTTCPYKPQKKGKQRSSTFSLPSCRLAKPSHYGIGRGHRKAVEIKPN